MQNLTNGFLLNQANDVIKWILNFFVSDKNLLRLQMIFKLTRNLHLLKNYLGVKFAMSKYEVVKMND